MSLHQFWRQFKRNHAAEISLYLILGFILAAILAPSISPYDPFVMGDETLQPPQSDHLMGTDDLGRDTLSRVIYGARVPLSVGFLAAATSLLLGAITGSVAGYFGGRTDDILMRATEYVLVIPRFFPRPADCGDARRRHRKNRSGNWSIRVAGGCASSSSTISDLSGARIRPRGPRPRPESRKNHI